MARRPRKGGQCDGRIAKDADPYAGTGYSPRVVEQVNFIRRAQQLGFSLDDAKQLLALADGTKCREARLLAEKKHELVEIQIARLEKMRSELEALIAACRDNRSRTSCPLVTALKQGA